MSEKQPAARVRAAIMAAPWMLTPEMLATVLSIADRENLSPEAVAAQLGRPLDNTHAVEVRDGVAIIPVDGVITRYADFFSAISGGVAIETLATDLRAALDNPAITGIVLNVDSPGGEANGVNEFAAMVRAADARKPVVAYVGGLAASAGYYLACAAGEVVVAADAIVGNIGVIMGVPDPAKTASRTINFISSQSPHKRPDPRTEDGKSRLQATVDALADVFVGAVATYRGLTPDAVTALGGDVLIGQAAVEAGLADRLGSFEGVIAELQQRAREPRRMASNAGRIAAQKDGEVMAEQRTGTRFERFMGWLGGEGDDSAFAAANIAASGAPIAGVVGTPAHGDAIGDPAGLPPIAQASTGESEELTRLRAELARRDQAERARAEADIAPRAQAFAEAEILAGRALPANRETLVAAYTDAATDDLAHPRAEGQPSRVARLEAVQSAHVPHALTGEAVPVKAGDAGTLHLLANAATTRAEGAPAPATVEGWREQRAFTATGRTILTALGIPATGPLSDAHRATIATRMREQGLTIAE